MPGTRKQRGARGLGAGLSLEERGKTWAPRGSLAWLTPAAGSRARPAPFHLKRADLLKQARASRG